MAYKSPAVFSNVVDAWNLLVGFACLDELKGTGFRTVHDLRRYCSKSEIHAFLQTLIDKKFVISQRGKHGGYLLFKKPEEVTFADVLDAFGETKSTSEADPFAIAMRVVRGTFRKITIADFLNTEIDFDREVDMLDELKKKVERVRKTATNPARPIFPPALKKEIVAAVETHGMAAVGVALNMHCPQIYKWRREITGAEIPKVDVEDQTPQEDIPPRVFVRKTPPPPPCPKVEVVEEETPVRVVQTIHVGDSAAHDDITPLQIEDGTECGAEDEECGAGECAATEEPQEEAEHTGKILCDITLRNGTNIRIYDV